MSQFQNAVLLIFTMLTKLVSIKYQDLWIYITIITGYITCTFINLSSKRDISYKEDTALSRCILDTTIDFRARNIELEFITRG